MNNIYQLKPLKVPTDASQVCSPTVPAKDDDIMDVSKRNVACRSENTRSDSEAVCRQHTVFVIDKQGKPLTPTTEAKARKLLKTKQAKKVWSKFNTFGVKMLVETRKETPNTVLGYDPGTKFEGLSVVTDFENNLNIKLDLPDKKKIIAKMKERSETRRTRRGRLRRRPARFQNRGRKGFIAPSQKVIVCSRLGIIRELCSIYPVSMAAIEDICFNHFKKHWGKNFSTMEIGKNFIRKWFDDRNIQRFEYKGYETSELRKKYGYKKTSDKSANKFSSHCCDSLTLAVNVGVGEAIPVGPFVVIDDTYRCVRRRIHDSNIKKGGMREKYSCGTVFGLQKGMMVGNAKGKAGQLCGQDGKGFKYYDVKNKRHGSKKLSWVNNQYKKVFDSATGQAF